MPSVHESSPRSILHFGLLVAGLILLALPVMAAMACADSTWVQHFRAGRVAYAAGDFAGFRSQLRIVRDSIGEQPGVNYNLACAAARLGQRDEALERLRRYALSGLTQDPAEDSDFVALWQDPGFKPIAARIRANGDSIGSARVQHRFRDASLLTEDLAYDPPTRRFFATSVHHGTVVEVGADGAEHVWRDPAARPGWSLFAARVDAPRRLLWTSGAATPTAAGYVAADSGRTGLTAWDLRTGTPKRRLEWPRDGRPRLLGDLTVGPDGTVYVCDSPAGAVRVVRPGAHAIETLAPDGAFDSPQTPALSADGRRLYVPDYSRGIGVLDLRTGARSWMTFATGLALQGIDGLYLRDGELIAVQNGTRPARVMRFRLDEAGTRVVSGAPIESGTVRLGQPTHGVIVGSEFCFLANTGWDRVGADERLSPAAAPPPVILRAALAPSASGAAARPVRTPPHRAH